MATTHYAWGPIRHGAEVEPKTGVVLKQKEVSAGTVVTAEKLGISKDEFEALVVSGAVRPQKYPEMPKGYIGSPKDFYMEQAKKSNEWDLVGMSDHSATDAEAEATRPEEVEV